MALSRAREKLVERLRNPRFRNREGCFLVEGIRGTRETLAGPLTREIQFALVSHRLAELPSGSELLGSLADEGVDVESVTDRELKRISDTDHPQGVLLVVKEPSDAGELLSGVEKPRALLLDGVQDPGNAGTLIRSARAFGLDAVLALDGTVDLFNPKVVRAAAGALAHLPVARRRWPDVEDWLARSGTPLLVAEAKGEDVRGLTPPDSWMLAVGNEGAGPRKEVLAKASQVVAIPMDPATDSLNVGLAGAILLFALSPYPGDDAES
jgi:TrmH family RNA methyltransferase